MAQDAKSNHGTFSKHQFWITQIVTVAVASGVALIVSYMAQANWLRQFKIQLLMEVFWKKNEIVEEVSVAMTKMQSTWSTAAEAIELTPGAPISQVQYQQLADRKIEADAGIARALTLIRLYFGPDTLVVKAQNSYMATWDSVSVQDYINNDPIIDRLSQRERHLLNMLVVQLRDDLDTLKFRFR
jgi:hypothetical protein